MGTRIIISILAFCWIACTLPCNSHSQDVARKYDTGHKDYQTLLDRIEKLEMKVEGHEAALNRIAELEKIVESHPTALEAVKLELRKEMDTLRHLHADEISNLKFKFDAEIKPMRNRNELHKTSKTANVVSETQSQDELKDITDDIEVKSTLALNRTDDITETKTGMRIEKKDKGSVVQQTNRIRRADGEMVVAFFSTLSTTTLHLGQNQNVKFDTVITNVGNAYDKHTGVFRAPVSGVYVFSTTIVANVKTNTNVGLFRNSQQLTSLWVNGSENDGDGSSNSIVVHLDQNDDVTVQHIGSDKSIRGDRFCMFSGFLLSQYGQSIIVGK